jgi:hypothetical protein
MKQIFLIILILVITSCVSQDNIIRDGPEFPSSQQLTQDISVPSEETDEELPDSLIRESYDKKLLVFLSPQYSQDQDIIKAIKIYQKAVEEDVKWGSEIILLSQDANTVGKIRERIKREYNNNPINAVIMAGEDIDTALNVESEDQESPSSVLWSDLNENIKFTIYNPSLLNKENKIIEPRMGAKEIDYMLKNPGNSISYPYIPEILVSFLYPSKADYEFKKQKIITAFDKFSKDRSKDYGNKIKLVQFDYSKNEQGEKIKDNFTLSPIVKPIMGLEIEYLFDCEICNRAIGENCVICNYGLNEKYKLYVVNGHGTPDSIRVSSKGTYFFRTYDLAKINSPLFITIACKSGGWYSGVSGNQRLDLPEGDSFSQEIFSNPNLRIFMGSSIAYPSDDYYSFVDDLNAGKTFAESFINRNKTMDSAQFYGDPTFHYS